MIFQYTQLAWGDNNMLPGLRQGSDCTIFNFIFVLINGNRKNAFALWLV